MISPEERAAQPGTGLFGSRGLIVEDSAYSAGLARALTRRSGVPVRLCATVAAAQAIVQAETIDWALIDTRLAGEASGLELAEWLRHSYPQVLRVSHAAFAPAPDTLMVIDARGPLFHATAPKPAAIAAIVEAIVTAQQRYKGGE